jgi:WD40 repeat protein
VKGKLIAPIADDDVNCLVFDPTGTMLAAGYASGRIVLWDVAIGEERISFEGRGGSTYWLIFMPDSRTLVSAAEDGAVRLWSVAP